MSIGCANVSIGCCMQAGLEASAAALLFSMHCVAAYPDMAELIYEEVVSFAGTSGAISWEALHEMQYGCLVFVWSCSQLSVFFADTRTSFSRRFCACTQFDRSCVCVISCDFTAFVHVRLHLALGVRLKLL